MPSLTTWLAFVVLAVVMVATPGPNMMVVVSRSLCQGVRAGLVSIAGVAVGFVVWMLCAVLGISAVLLTLPFSYDALRIGGALYLGWMAWSAVRPGGRSPFEVRELPPDSPRRLFLMGLFTNLLNPKAAILYLSLLPQFIDPARGSVATQGLVFGFTQIVVSMIGNALFAASAGAIARVLQRRRRWLLVQRWLMGTVLGALALRMAVGGGR